MPKQLFLITLDCGHFVRYRGLAEVPATGDYVVCLKCPRIDDKAQVARVRVSPKSGFTLYARCQDCTYTRRSTTARFRLHNLASTHAKRNSHKVIITEGKKETEINFRQEQLDLSGEPPF